MENINLQLLRKINCLLTGLLAIIGFSCGENGEIPCEYGSPHANFQIKGKVTDMKGEPIPDLQVRINPSGESHPQGWLHTDTLQTDTNGDFIFSKTDFPFMEYRLIIEDIDWDKNKAIYASDTITVTFDSNDFSGGEGWSLGSASKEIQIQLKEYIDTHTEPYTLYTFYGRVTDQDGWPVPGVTIYTSPAYTPNIDEDITSFPAVTDETGRYQFTYDQAPATEHTLYARLSPSFSDPQYPWKTDSIVVNFGEIELIDGEGMLIGRGSKEVNFQLVHSSPQKRTPPPQRPSNSPLIPPRNLPEQLNITSLNLNIRSQFLPLRTNIRHLKNAPLTNPTPGNRTTKCRKLRMILFKCIPCIHNLHHISNISNITNTHNQHQPFPYYHLCFLSINPNTAAVQTIQRLTT